LTPFLGKDVEITDRDYHSMVNHFIAVLLGSICVGLACGALCTLYFYFLRNSTGPVSEVGSFFCWALIPYYIADGIGCSGIISIMVMGFTSDYFVIGGFQSEDVAWMDYMAIRTDHELRASNHLVAGWSDYIFVVISTAFSGTGHILARSRHHVGFVSELLSEMFETALFSYLGLFLFNDSSWNLRLNSTGIFGCVVSRIVMVVSLSLVINMAIFFDLSRHLRRVFQSTRNPGEDVLDPSSQDRVFIDHRAQLIIILSGIRGAVSFALVESIPVYNTVAKSGSQFKPELKAMTSSSIVFTLFVFGALTYFTVEREPSNLRSSRVTGPLTRRRARSEPLDNEGENTNGSSGMHEYSSTPHERSVVRGASAFNVENSDNPRMVPLLNDFGESS
jgi:NhaP-type Na+/H+ or K+/H+ antiporter